MRILALALLLAFSLGCSASAEISFMKQWDRGQTEVKPSTETNSNVGKVK